MLNVTIARTLVVSSSIPTQAAQTQTNAKLWTQNTGWILAMAVLVSAFAITVVRLKQQIKAIEKQQRFEQFKSRELKKRLQLSLQTIRRMEQNPDLIHSREFNLDYLRMRMAEVNFHNAIVNQVKNRVKEQIAIALREGKSEQVIGIANKAGRQINRTFDVEYNLRGLKKAKSAVLFRVQIRLLKLPMQATSVTVKQVVDCLEAYMSPTTDHATWQPTLQGRIVTISWDQAAKPTPLLVLEQLNDGSNVTFRTKGIA